MIEVKTNLRKWGNSFRIFIPKKMIDDEKIKEGDEIVVLLKKEEKSMENVEFVK